MIEVKPNRADGHVAKATAKTTGVFFRGLRDARGLTQLHLATRADYSTEVIAALENGRRMVSPRTMRALVDAMDSVKPIDPRDRELLMEIARAGSRRCLGGTDEAKARRVLQATLDASGFVPSGLQGPSPCTSELPARSACPKRMDASGVYRRVSLTEGGEG